jgi:hypothetical protein
MSDWTRANIERLKQSGFTERIEYRAGQLPKVVITKTDYFSMQDIEYGEGCEDQFQADAERWLREEGYLPRTKNGVNAPVGFTGWYIHVRNARGNPYCLDLLVLHRSGKYVEIELKAAGGKVSREQDAIIKRTGKIARTMAEFAKHVKEMEAR